MKKNGLAILLESTKIQERFWRHVNIAGPDDCWPWKGPRDDYANFKVCSYIKERSNRIALAIKLGRELGELLSLHTCDNKKCCNPGHLYEGDIFDNARDVVVRKRRVPPPCQYQGEKNPNSKLTEDQVKEIIGLINEGLNNKRIAIRFGVTHASISLIRLGKQWKHLERKFQKPYTSLRKKTG